MKPLATSAHYPKTKIIQKKNSHRAKAKVWQPVPASIARCQTLAFLYYSNRTNLLYQNTPNPFNNTTKIEYYLSQGINEAIINIYDMNGTQLKSYPLHLYGYGNITINGSELKAGMYLYSLIANGQLIDTKRMVLTN